MVRVWGGRLPLGFVVGSGTVLRAAGNGYRLRAYPRLLGTAKAAPAGAAPRSDGLTPIPDACPGHRLVTQDTSSALLHGAGENHADVSVKP